MIHKGVEKTDGKTGIQGSEFDIVRPEPGVFVANLVLVGASWSRRKGILEEMRIDGCRIEIVSVGAQQRFRNRQWMTMDDNRFDLG